MIDQIRKKLAWKLLEWRGRRAADSEVPGTGLLGTGQKGTGLLGKAGVGGGGALLWATVGGEEIGTPERFTPEQRALARLAREFSENEIRTRTREIEDHSSGALVALLKKAGELGLLGMDVPEAYGGLGSDKTTSMLVAENLSGVASFAVSLGAHVGIGTLPIVYYGTNEQRRQHLPDLATGKKLAAYALTEAESGSDALSARTTATPVESGTAYRIEGTKQFITNAGFADLFVVFAQVVSGSERKFTAFLVESGTAGLSTGAEENKMGIRGSSTRSVILRDVRVPASAVLGEIGKGHRIAFDILDAGRLRLGAASTGACKHILATSAKYALDRHQFGRPIAAFGLIQQKLTGMMTRIYAAESMAYRITSLVDADTSRRIAGGGDPLASSARALAEYAIECSILKVYGSEALNYCVDEGVQLHGGYGFIEEFEIARLFRDSRINRIFEGTNEINRLLIPGTLFRRAAKGEIAFVSEVESVRAALAEDRSPTVPDGPLEDERRAVTRAKWIFLTCAGETLRKYQKGVQEQQELLGALADMAIEIAAMDSSVARTLMRLADGDPSGDDVSVDMARLIVHDGYLRVLDLGHKALESLFAGEALADRLFHESRMDLHRPLAWVETSRRIAARALDARGWPL